MYIIDKRTHDYCVLGDLNIGDFFIDNGYLYMKIGSKGIRESADTYSLDYEPIICVQNGEILWEINTTPIRERISVTIELHEADYKVTIE